jgi:hypothetical protein
MKKMNSSENIVDWLVEKANLVIEDKEDYWMYMNAAITVAFFRTVPNPSNYSINSGYAPVLLPVEVIKREAESSDDMVYEDLEVVHEACVDSWNAINDLEDWSDWIIDGTTQLGVNND